ncbi:sorbosone dehydrogenase family protein [Pseudomonas sp. GD04087]|uniref:PQQ-dependent sugar dehydrogenase n=1 Tax=unclassified Pseudomonas TaxID=196821 RepID=UPI00244A5030|nr:MULTISPECIES: sorbosone dehydrogenase family protein [unclassified Pseudomonas]MDH0288452.1 sorbosone dehydrogenase family protein [Pseudomonas sp. GD04087]MDH1048605.1 sorbosone dehydrogenase family protein [Pseudomonas sp. GD03903]MDH2000890.1 sorbosone dehydrogenase family protein [Pseudomonas sp. GD03691]
MRWSFPFLAALALTGCGDKSALPFTAGTGPQPQLPEPQSSLLPTVNIATATGWPAGQMPRAAQGLEVQRFADQLEHPRWLYVLPNGDVLVAESSAPPKEESGGLKDWVAGKVMAKAGASVPSANRITLLRDADGDGVPEQRSVLLEGLFSPFGMALVDNWLYVANADAVVRFPYQTGETTISAPAEKVVDLPGGPINHHWTKNILASPDGRYLYATVGSNSNVGENGLEAEKNRAAILQIDLSTRDVRVFASGLRNPNGMGWEPNTGALWTAVNERDELGNDLVPDYMTSVKDGGFYGWPWSYFGQHVDKRVEPARPDMVEKALVPDYALGSHTASLGLAFYQGSLLPERYRGGVFIGQHGSWNRKPRSGYQVVFIPFAGGKPNGQPMTVLDGFINDKDEAMGRPVGVAVDKFGGLLVADDVGNTVWRLRPATLK